MLTRHNCNCDPYIIPAKAISCDHEEKSEDPPRPGRSHGTKFLKIDISFVGRAGGIFWGREVDDRQITHLISVRLEHLLYDFFRGCFGPSI